ncbi:MAG: oxidoreductase, partial [Rhodobacterales bacterium 17-64-5]
MSVIVTDTGFAPATQREVVALADLADQTAVDLANTDDPQVLVGRLDQLTLIRVAFP